MAETVAAMAQDAAANLSAHAMAASSSSSAVAEARGGVCPGERWGNWPSPVGLVMGIVAALVAQVLVFAYHYARLRWLATRRVQKEPRPYNFMEGVLAHVGSPGGILMISTYLVVTWMFEVLPCSYYQRGESLRCWMVAALIATQDLIQYSLHYFEHKGPFGHVFYRISHKPHHQFVNPRLFDAFCATPLDNFCMVIVPLIITTQLWHANHKEYMAFGACWSSWLILIHSEVDNPWDPLFRVLGLGTAADHHVHHRTFIYNYGHTVMWWDKLCGTYKQPETVRQFNTSRETHVQGGSQYTYEWRDAYDTVVGAGEGKAQGARKQS